MPAIIGLPKTPTLLLLLLLAASLCAPPSYGADKPAPANAVIRVQFVMPEGMPLDKFAWKSSTGRIVVLNPQGAAITSKLWGDSFMDGDGRATLTIPAASLPKDDCTLKVTVTSQSSFPFAAEVALAFNRSQLQEGAEPFKVTLKYVPDGGERDMKYQLVSGTTGKPISKREVCLWEKNWLAKRAVTDENGMFSFHLRNDKEYFIEGNNDDGGELSRTKVQFLPATPGEKAIVITTRPTVAVVQLVVVEDGKERLMTEANNDVEVDGLTDDVVDKARAGLGLHGHEYKDFDARPRNGILTLYGPMPTGTYSVKLLAGATAYAAYVVVSAPSFRIKPGQPPLEGKLVLRRAIKATAEVLIKDAQDGTAIANAKMRLTGPGESGAATELSADAAGRIRMDIKEGRYAGDVSADGYQGQRIRVNAPAKDPATVALNHFRTLRFQLTTTGNQAGGSELVVLQADEKAGSNEYSSAINAKGAARISQAVDGPAVVLVFTNKGIAYADRMEVAGDKTMTIGELGTPVRVAGRIQTPAGLPVTRAQVCSQISACARRKNERE